MQKAVPTTSASAGATDSRFSQLHTAMSNTVLKQVPWRTQEGKLTSITTTTTVKEALDLLTRENILAVPVFDGREFKGFCDYMQLTRFVVRLADGQIPSSTWWTEHDQIRTTTVWDLVQGYTTSSGRAILGEYIPPLSPKASLYDCIQAMAASGNHRVGILNDAGDSVDALMTQSVVLSWLNDNMDDLGEVAFAKVSDIRPYTDLTKIRADQTALRAFELMDQRRTAQNGIAVVDTDGKLVDVISTHDLRGIAPGSKNFDNLYLTVKDFKSDVNERYNTKKQTGLYTCVADDTLETVVKKMTNHKIHRLVVVNNTRAMTPVDMVSQTDIMRFLVEKVKPMWL
jgi:CBS domain-containing protein